MIKKYSVKRYTHDDHTTTAVSSGRVGNGNLATRVMPRSYNQCKFLIMHKMQNNITTNVLMAISQANLGQPVHLAFFLYLFLSGQVVQVVLKARCPSGHQTKSVNTLTVHNTDTDFNSDLQQSLQSFLVKLWAAMQIYTNKKAS